MSRRALGHALAATCRDAPFDRGRWRIGSLAYKLLDGGQPGGMERAVRTRRGFRMNLDLGEFVDRTIFCTGEWEPRETAVIAGLLRQGDVFVDVGANIGYFTLLASQIVGAAGRIIAVEANPRTFRLLEANVRLNGCSNVDLRHVAAGEAPGFATMVEREPGNAGGDQVDFAKEDAPGSVAVERLDTLVGEQPVRLIKLDIEGAEAKALRGATGLLERADAPDLVFEFTPKFLAGMGDEPRELIGLLERLGYRLQTIGNAGPSPADERIYAAEQTYLYCTKRSAAQ